MAIKRGEEGGAVELGHMLHRWQRLPRACRCCSSRVPIATALPVGAWWRRS